MFPAVSAVLKQQYPGGIAMPCDRLTADATFFANVSEVTRRHLGQPVLLAQVPTVAAGVATGMGTGLGNRLLLSALCLSGAGTDLPSLLRDLRRFGGLLSQCWHLRDRRLCLWSLQRRWACCLVQSIDRCLWPSLHPTISVRWKNECLGL